MPVNYIGDFAEDSIVDLFWDTNDGNGASVTRAVDGGIRVYKNNSAAEKITANGVTDDEDFDLLTGIHHLRIDTSNDTGDAGFWIPGNDYFAVLQGATIDGQAVNAVIAHFSIENRFIEADVTKWLGTAPLALSSQRVQTHVASMGSGVIAAATFASSAITSTVLANGAITAAKFAAGAVDATAFAQGAADKVWSSTTRTLTAFSTALAVAVWDVLESAIATASSIGLKVKTNLDAAVSTRATPGDVPTSAANADAVWDEARSGHVAAGSFGEGAASVQGNVTGSVGSLGATAKADVNAEVVDVVNTDALAELAQGAPPATPSLFQAVMLLYMMARNKITTDATNLKVHNDSGVVITKKSLSDDGTTFAEDEMVTGP